MARFCEVRQSDGIVLNVIEYDGEAPYSPPKGMDLIPAPEGPVCAGMIYRGGEFSLPEIEPRFIYRIETSQICQIIPVAKDGEAPIPGEGLGMISPDDLSEIPEGLTVGWFYDPEAGTLTPPN